MSATLVEPAQPLIQLADPQVLSDAALEELWDLEPQPVRTIFDLGAARYKVDAAPIPITFYSTEELWIGLDQCRSLRFTPGAIFPCALCAPSRTAMLSPALPIGLLISPPNSRFRLPLSPSRDRCVSPEHSLFDLRECQRALPAG